LKEKDCDSCKYFRRDAETCRLNSCPYKKEKAQKNKKGKKRKLFAVYFSGSEGKKIFLENVRAYSELQARSYAALKRGDWILRNQMIALEVNKVGF